MENPECQVCCFPLNKTYRKNVSCACGYVQCSNCVEKYVLSLTDTPECMNCHIPWDTAFLTTHLTKTFITKTYKTHKENMLFERERSMFPETMPHVETYISIKKRRDEINRLVLEMGETLKKPFNYATVLNESTENTIQRFREIATNKNELSQFDNEIEFNAMCIRVYQKHMSTANERKFIHACSVSDCRGFLSTQWKCALCNIWTCSHCHETIGPSRTDTDHVCLESNLKTVELLNKDSRPCPKCASLIFRISGCPVMFCTHCHTGFNWNTGKEHKGAIHNPHYFDYVRTHNTGADITGADTTGADTGTEGQCPPTLPSYKTIRQKEMDCIFTTSAKTSMFVLVQNYNHVNQMILPTLLPETNIADLNRDIRVQYLVNEITETKFKTLLQQRDKRERKKQDNLHVCQMYLQVTSDILQRFVKEAITREHHRLFTEEYAELLKYTNNCLEKIGSQYGCVPLRLGITAI
jgi:hypothetical protein